MLILKLGILLAGAQASARGIESSIHGFDLKSCNSAHDKCVVVKAEKTQGSQMKMLHYLKNPEVTISSAKTEVLHGDSGYVDLEENQLVLYKKENGRLTETSLDLGTLEHFTAETEIRK